MSYVNDGTGKLGPRLAEIYRYEFGIDLEWICMTCLSAFLSQAPTLVTGFSNSASHHFQPPESLTGPGLASVVGRRTLASFYHSCIAVHI